jgi:haloalkane dehalogenase
MTENCSPQSQILQKSPAFQEHRVLRYGNNLSVREYRGAGPAFVLMHGFPDNLHIYDDLIPHLVAAGRHVVAFDFLGFGASEGKIGTTYSFAQQPEDLEAVVDALHLGKIVPVGHDASGPAAINFTLDHPERVAFICLLNSLYGAAPSIRAPELVMLFATASLKAFTSAALQDAEQVAWLLRFQQTMFHNALPEPFRPHFLSTVVPIMNGNFNGEHSSAAAFAQMTGQLFPEIAKNTARLSTLASLDVPVTFIWGEHDPYIGSGVARDLVPYFKKATLNVLPAGHWPQIG